MPFRERLRKAISRSDASSSSHSTKSTSGSTSSTTSTSRKNSLFYQPGEVIPYKYKRPVAKEHKAKLEAFSFAGAWRRSSHASQYSPMGSRAVSRRNSVASQLRRGFGKRGHGSVGSLAGERGVDADRPMTSRLQEQVAPGDELADKESTDSAIAMDSPQHDTPFSQEELALALQRSHLDAPLRV